MYKFNRTKLLSVFLFLSANLYSMEIGSVLEAVDTAGKQRMLTQKMLKDYVMVGMSNNFENPGADLEDTVIMFGEHMQSLYDFTNSKEIRKSIVSSQNLWKGIKVILKTKPTKENAKKLQLELDKLLKNADITTKLFASQTGKKSGEIVDISGRQRMLSQRITSLYVMKSWGIDDSEFVKKMKDSMNLFRTSLDRLSSYKGNNEEIKHLLEKVDYNFKFFEFMRSSKVTIPTLLYKKSANILKDMNIITRLYVKKIAQK